MDFRFKFQIINVVSYCCHHVLQQPLAPSYLHSYWRSTSDDQSSPTGLSVRSIMDGRSSCRPEWYCCAVTQLCCCWEGLPQHFGLNGRSGK
jgi:hypothetical protein